MKKFIRRAVFVAAAASAVIAYLKSKLEQEEDVDMIIIEPDEPVWEEIRVEKADDENPIEEINDIDTNVLESVNKAIEDVHEIVEPSHLEIPIEFNESEDDVVVDDVPEETLAEVEQTKVIVNEANHEIEEIVKDVISASQTSDITDEEEFKEVAVQEVEEQQEALDLSEKVFEENLDNIIDEVIETTMQMNVVDDVNEDLNQLTQEVIELSEQDYEDDSIPFDSQEYDINELNELFNEENQIRNVFNEETQNLFNEISNSSVGNIEVQDTSNETIEDVEASIIEVELEDTLVDLQPITESEMAEEEVKQEPQQPLIAEDNPFPHLSEKRIDAIKNQVNSMMEALGEADELYLKHYAVFKTKHDHYRYESVAEILGYEITELNENNEAFLYKTSSGEKDSILHEILTLADTLKAYNASYKGWKVIDNKTK